MGKDGDDVSKHPPPTTRNEVSGDAHGPVVQANTIDSVVVNAGAPTRSEVDDWTASLARGVEKLWEREEAHRRVHDPVALPVRWHTAAAELADDWVNIRRLPAGATAEPLDLAGRIEQLGETYRRIPSGRLVLLGQAGAGKTVLASRLALDLLAARAAGQRVPVIVGVGSWNPATTPLHVWLAEQLARDHPGLAVPVGKGGPTRAAALLENDRILPILDSFDEISIGLRKDALRQLNTTPDTPVVITSRIDEYTIAVRDFDVLTAAAVVELDELTVEDLAAYLPRTAGGHRTGIWDPVLERMRAEQHVHGPATLRQVLTNPLMVFLARTIYSETPRHDPAELLDTHRFPTAPALRKHLLAAFVPAAYLADQPENTRGRWPADRAHRYLTYLANHLHKADTRDLAWWQLDATLARPARVLITGIVAAPLGTVLGLLAYILADLLSTTRIDAAEFHQGLLETGTGLAAGLAAGLVNELRRKGAGPERLRLGTSQLSRPAPARALRRLGAEGITGLAVGIAFSLASWLGYGYAYGFSQPSAGRFLQAFVPPLAERLPPAGVWIWCTAGLVLGLLVGITYALANILVHLFSGANYPDSAPSFWDLLTLDRVVTLFRIVMIGFMVGLVNLILIGNQYGIIVGNQHGILLQNPNDAVFHTAVREGVLYGLLYGSFAVLTRLLLSAWGRWLVFARLWLPLTRRLPWQAKPFLIDAYERGVLRQAGAVYQFRHAWLQDRLTTDAAA